MMFDEHKPEDLDTTLEDHIADAMRYFCMNRPIKPKKKIVGGRKIAFDPLNLLNQEVA